MNLTPNDLPDTFYRVSIKALVFDAKNRLLVFMDKNHEWEMPGGGWEHAESMEACVIRELAEEVRISVSSVADVQFCYRGHNKDGFPKLSLAVPVTLGSMHFVPVGDNLAEVAFVTKTEFMKLAFQSSESAVSECVDQIWPPVEK